MNITVSPKLMALINTIEERERAETPKAEFSWSYYPSGEGASGLVFINWAYKEFDVSVAHTSDAVNVYSRELSKHDGDDWATDPLDSDYEGDI